MAETNLLNHQFTWIARTSHTTWTQKCLSSLRPADYPFLYQAFSEDEIIAAVKGKHGGSHPEPITVDNAADRCVSSAAGWMVNGAYPVLRAPCLIQAAGR